MQRAFILCFKWLYFWFEAYIGKLPFIAELLMWMYENALSWPLQDLSSLSQKQKKSKSFCIGEPLTSLHSSEPQRGTMVRKSRAEKWRRIKLPCLMEKYKEDYSHGKLILYWIWAGPLEGFLNPVFQKSLCKTLRGGCLEVLSHPSVEPTKREEGFSSEWRLCQRT